MYALKLFITGKTPNSLRAIRHLEDFMGSEFKGDYTLEIVDVINNPDAAEVNNILATPTLIKEKPGPTTRVLGDLSDMQKVGAALDLKNQG